VLHLIHDPAPGSLVTARIKEDNDLSLHTVAAAAADQGVRMTAPATTAPDQMTSEALRAAVIASLEDDKAEDIVQIDLRGRSDMGDWMVIASGRSTRQVAAIAEKLADRVKQSFGIISKMEGRETADWVLIDTGDIIVHIFRPEVREFYQLEKMWMPTGAMTPAP
jgi:ribosome-associated protein